MIRKAYIEKYQVSKQLRFGNKKQRAALEKFVNLKKFKGLKPTPDQLTKECLKKSSPLYGIIKTNVKSAAESYWRDKSQDMLRHINLVRIDIITEEVLNKPVKAYVPIKRERYGRIPESNYRPTVQIQKNPELVESLLSQMQLEFIAWMSRWERYAEFFEEFKPVIEAYHKIENRLDVLTLAQAKKKKNL